MNVPIFLELGSSKIPYDETNVPLLGQWKDNKVVSFLSIFLVVGNEIVKCYYRKENVNLAVQRQFRHKLNS